MNALPSQITVSLGGLVEILGRGVAGALRRDLVRLQGAGDRPRGRRHAGLDDRAGDHRNDAGPRPKERIAYRSGAQLQRPDLPDGQPRGRPTWAPTARTRETRPARCRKSRTAVRRLRIPAEKYLKPRVRGGHHRGAGRGERSRPTSMIDLTDGLASDLMQLCKASSAGRASTWNGSRSRSRRRRWPRRCTPTPWWQRSTEGRITNCNYETVFIVTPVLSEAQVQEVADKFQGVITENGGQLVNVEKWGLKSSLTRFRTRPPVSTSLVEFTGEGSLINTLETQYRRDERVIRFLTFKQDKYAVEYSEKRRAKLSNKTQEE